MSARLLGSSLATASACLALTVALAGCDSGEPDPADPSESATSPTEPTGSTSTSPTETTPTASVEPATGPLLRGEGVTVNAPEGWALDDPVVEFAASANAPDSTDLLVLTSSAAIGDPSLREQAESVLKVGGWLQDPEILPPVTVGGVEMFHVAGQIDSTTNLEMLGTIHSGHQVEISLTFSREFTPAAVQREITESVWASVAWTD